MKHRHLVLVASTLASLAGGCGDNLTHPADTHAPVGGGGASGSGSGGGDAFSCVPNLDGRVDAEELAAVFDVPVSYVVNPEGEPRDVDLRGRMGEAGRVWDFSQS